MGWPLSSIPWGLGLASTGFAAFCGGIAAVFVGHRRADAAAAASVAFALHLGFFVGAAAIEAPTPAPQPLQRARNYEVAQVVPEPPLEPLPEPAPEPLPEPAPEPLPEPPPPSKKAARKPPPRRSKRAVDNNPIVETPPTRRIVLGAAQLGGNRGVVVADGPPGSHPDAGIADPGAGAGTPRSKGVPPTPGGDDGGPIRAKPDWRPVPKTAVAKLPRPLTVPIRPCPAAVKGEVQGTVQLRVQVRANGRVRRVTVRAGIGHGCDAVAAKALKRARFAPAMTTGGDPTDYEIEYEYVFTRK